MPLKSAHQKALTIFCISLVTLECAVLYFNNNYHHQLQQDSLGSKCYTTKPSSGMLSIHMVIVPFLRYPAPVAKTRILKRLEEYKYVLERNLAHPLVQCIHILTTNSTETLQLFDGLSNLDKLLVSEVKSIDLARDPFRYISQNLLGRDVMYASADIYLGAGFELVDPTIMDMERIMYSITRRLAPVECYGDSVSRPAWNCKAYIGCHDVFLFRLHEPLPETFLEQLDFDLVSPGIENIVNDLFMKELGYCVTNPCAILQTFHYHCSNLRNKEGKPKVIKSHKQGLIGFSNQLDCSTS